MDLSRFRIDRSVLANGVRLLIVENDRLPLAHLSALVLAGADCNPLQQPGLAALTGRMLDEGTTSMSAREIAAKVEDFGGILTTFSDRQMAGVTATFVRDHVDHGIDLLAETVRRPVFPAQRLEKEKEKTLTQLEAVRDDPYVVMSNLLIGAIYQGTPLQYPVTGTMESVSAITARDTLAFHRSHYGPSNTLLVVAGDVKAERVKRWAEGHFGDWREPERQKNGFRPLKRQMEPLTIRQSLQKRQVYLSLGHLGICRNNPDFPALQVLDVALGSGPGFASRVPRRLRDELGLAYSATCDITATSGIHPGIFSASLSTSPQKLDQSRRELLRILDSVRREGINAEELSMAQDFLTGSFVFDFQSNADLARFLVSVELFGLGTDYPERYPQEIYGVTLEDVRRVARQYLDTLHYTTVIVGPVEGG